MAAARMTGTLPRIAAGLLLLLAALAWAAGTETALRWVAGRIEASGGVSLTDASGSLYGPIAIRSLRYEDPSVRVDAGDVAFDWQPWKLLLLQKLELETFEAGSLDIRLGEFSPDPLPRPETLRLPVALSIPDGKIARITLIYGERSAEFTGLRFGFAQEDGQHRLTVSRLATPWGDASADIGIGLERPFALGAQGALAGNGTDLKLAARGSLDGMTANAEGSAGAVKVSASVQAELFEANILRALNLDATGLNPRRLDDAWPAADIALELHARADRAGELSGNVRLANALPGPLDAGRLPLAELSAGLAGNTAHVRFPDLNARLHGGGTMKGSAGIAADGPLAKLAVSGMNLRGLHSRLARTALNGDMELGWEGGDGTLLAELAQGRYRIRLDAGATGDRVVLRDALVRAGRGELQLAGTMSTSGAGDFELKGELRRFDPALFGDFPAARIDAALNASGKLIGRRRIAAALAIADSRWAGQPLSGKARLLVEGDRLADAEVSLRLAENRLIASGSLGAAGDRLSLDLDAPDLGRFGAGLAGSVRAQGVVAGAYDAPSGTLDATAAGLGWEGYRLERGKLSARLSEGLDGPAHVEAEVSGLRGSGVDLSHADAELDGTRGRHRATFSARGERLDLRGALTGGWRDAQGWEGTLERLENKGAYPAALLAPAILAAKPGAASLRGARLRFLGGALAVEDAAYVDGELTTRGSFTGMPAGELQRLSGAFPAMKLSLMLGGNWDLSLGRHLDGTMDIRRESGDALMPGEPGTALGIGALELKLAARDNRVALHADARGSRLGSISARGATTLSRRDGAWGIDGDAPVEGNAEVAVQTLAWLAPLVSPVLAGDGALNMKLDLRGTAAAPRFAGRIDGTGLRLEAPNPGVYLKNGILRAELADDGVRIRELSFDSGAGRLDASGEARLREGAPRATLAIVADKAELVSRPDRLLVVSGKTSADLADGRLRIGGKLVLDRGLVELPKANLPTLSDDVEIAGEEEAAMRKAERMRTDVDLEIDLGKQSFLKGRGLDAQLAGAVRIRSGSAGLPLASGSIRVEKGDYLAYGQRLTIERGILNFSGPLDNPGLNILAMRKNQEVEAGVAITGTALAPQVRLVSNPPVPDGEKMSWLVLGHGLAGSSGSELDLMGAAASALLATGESVTLQSEIAHAAGLDEFGLSGGSGLANTAVTLGKRLSSRAYLSYEQSVAGADSLVKVNYLLTPRWSVRAQGGTDNAVDLFYTLSFD